MPKDYKNYGKYKDSSEDKEPAGIGALIFWILAIFVMAFFYTSLYDWWTTR